MVQAHSTAQHTARMLYARQLERCYYRPHVMPVVVALHTPCTLAGRPALLVERWGLSHA
jgi:hypothetical protein